MLAAIVVSLPLLAPNAVGEGVASRTTQVVRIVKPATFSYGANTATLNKTSAVLAAQTRVPTPSPTAAPPPLPLPTPVPTQPPPPAPTAHLCADAAALNIVDAEITGVVQQGIDLLTGHFGCQRFYMDARGVPIKFADITPMLGDKVLGYANNAPGAYEIWLNRDCWGVVGAWDGVVAHELGHYLGWRHGDDHPFMWLPPPPGSYARTDDGALVCF